MIHVLDLAIEKLDLSRLELDELIEIARSRDLISRHTIQDERIYIYLGSLKLDFSPLEAHLYLRGLIRGHLRTLLKEQ